MAWEADFTGYVRYEYEPSQYYPGTTSVQYQLLQWDASSGLMDVLHARETLDLTEPAIVGRTFVDIGDLLYFVVDNSTGDSGGDRVYFAATLTVVPEPTAWILTRRSPLRSGGPATKRAPASQAALAAGTTVDMNFQLIATRLTPSIEGQSPRVQAAGDRLSVGINASHVTPCSFHHGRLGVSFMERIIACRSGSPNQHPAARLARIPRSNKPGNFR